MIELCNPSLRIRCINDYVKNCKMLADSIVEYLYAKGPIIMKRIWLQRSVRQVWESRPLLLLVQIVHRRLSSRSCIFRMRSCRVGKVILYQRENGRVILKIMQKVHELGLSVCPQIPGNSWVTLRRKKDLCIVFSRSTKKG